MIQTNALPDLISHKAQNQPYWFFDFMQDALYTPHLGYYRNERIKFGKEGDFITAPSLGSLFGKTLAIEVENLLCQVSQKNILEFGAGAGHLACDLLNTLGPTVEHYFILEMSSALIVQQKAMLERLCPRWAHKVNWLNTLPVNFIGIMLANEVLDAMPVHRFRMSENQAIEAMSVTFQAEAYRPLWLPAPLNVQQAIVALQADLEVPLSAHYESEYCPWIYPWIQSLHDCLQDGAILLIDYGFPRRDYYHPSRSQGTLMCHHRHQSNSDPFWQIGQQDITAHVDFTAVALAASEAGLTVCGYCAQGPFLMSLGITGTLIEASIFNILISPAEMGELFKVMLLGTRHFSTLGFRLQDDRIRL